ncbi:MAG: NAD(+) diphosphatase [Alphaproteobacteria bacterium]|nr:NAD(+) diphosphatase [Alphaproteobacteria bacterium]
MTPMAFVHSPLDRKANHRSDAGWLQQRRAARNAKFIQVHGDAVRMQEGKLAVAAPASAETPLVFLGEEAGGTPWFAFAGNSEGEMQALRPLMVGGALAPAELSILAQARSLVHWHEKHGFCAACGQKTEMSDGGYRRHCAACGADHFPRTDPVVIMAVQHGGNILLGRQKAWAPGMYSAIAGFMEPGETIEQAVAREVLEETGVVTGAVRYVASQPWPFPSSLMIGCIAEAVASQITLDEKELENARWFSRADVRLMLDHKHPEGIHASHPWAIAHTVISAALQ